MSKGAVLSLYFLKPTDKFVFSKVAALSVQNSSENPWTPESIAAFAKQEGNHFMMAESSDGQLVGYIAYTTEPVQNKQHIADFQIAPEYANHIYSKSINYSEQNNEYSCGKVPKSPGFHMFMQIVSLSPENMVLDSSALKSASMVEQLVKSVNEYKEVEISTPAPIKPISHRDDMAYARGYTPKPLHKKILEAKRQLIAGTGVEWVMKRKIGKYFFDLSKRSLENNSLAETDNIYFCTSHELENKEAAITALANEIGHFLPVKSDELLDGILAIPAMKTEDILKPGRLMPRTLSADFISADKVMSAEEFELFMTDESNPQKQKTSPPSPPTSGPAR